MQRRPNDTARATIQPSDADGELLPEARPQSMAERSRARAADCELHPEAVSAAGLTDMRRQGEEERTVLASPRRDGGALVAGGTALRVLDCRSFSVHAKGWKMQGKDARCACVTS